MENEEKIIFHEEEVQEVKKGPTPKKLNVGIILIVIYTLMQILNIVAYESTNFPKWILNINYFSRPIVFVIPIILGAISFKPIKKKNLNGKGKAILCIVLPPICFLITTLISFAVMIDNAGWLVDSTLCPTAEKCTDNGDGTSSCIFIDEDDEENEIQCDNRILDEHDIPYKK